MNTPELKHTPNDWYAVRHEHGGPPANGECYRIDIRGNPIKSPAGQVVASEPICSLYDGFAHFEGNAALILAAPKLLAEVIDVAAQLEELSPRLKGIGAGGRKGETLDPKAVLSSGLVLGLAHRLRAVARTATSAEGGAQ